MTPDTLTSSHPCVGSGGRHTRSLAARQHDADAQLPRRRPVGGAVGARAPPSPVRPAAPLYEQAGMPAFTSFTAGLPGRVHGA